MANKLGDLVVAVAADLNPFSSSIARVPAMVGRLSADVARRSASFTGDVVKGALGVAGGNLLGGALGDVLRVPPDLVRDSVMAAAKVEKLGVQFEVLTGSAANARDLMGEVKAFAVESGLGMEDAAAGAKKLLAAGVGLKQIVPTLRTLSDVSMGDRDLIGRSILAFTQVKATGNVQGDELNQLSELGVPIKAAIAAFKGIGVDELAKAVENREVSFRDLQGGLKALTSEGGKFFKMTERGADTLDGTFGKLGDAVEDLKREFGRAIVEEVGLKDALKDGTRFANEMKGFVNELRPAIKFTGDLLKGAAQVFGELVRNGPLFAHAFGDAFKRAVPWAGKLVDDVGRAVKSLQDFKLNPEDVVAVALDVGSAIGEFLDFLFVQMGKALDSVALKVKPITDAVADAAKTWLDVKAGFDAFGRVFEQRKRDEWLKAERDAGRVPDVEDPKWFKQKLADDELKLAKPLAAMEKAAGRGLTLREVNDPAVRGDLWKAQEDLKKQVEEVRDSLHRFHLTVEQSKFAKDIDRAMRAAEEVPGARRRVFDDAAKAAELAKKLGAKDLKAGDLDLLKPLPPVDQGEFGKAMQTFKDEFKKGMAELVQKYSPKPAAADPVRGALGGLAGGLGVIDPALGGPKKVEFELDPEKLRDPLKDVGKGDFDRRNIPLPTAAEFGSQQATELWQRSLVNQAPDADAQQLRAALEQVQLLKEIALKVGRESLRVIDLDMR
jgi:tape measure domain-containing protein